MKGRELGNRVAGADYGLATKAGTYASLPRGCLIATGHAGGESKQYLSETMFFPERCGRCSSTSVSLNECGLPLLYSEERRCFLVGTLTRRF